MVNRRRGTVWSRKLAQCEATVRRLYQLIGATEDGPAKDWLARIVTDLDEELAEVERLARLGHATAPKDPQADGTATEILARLDSAAQSFTDTLDRAVDVVLELTVDTDFELIRAQVELLRAEAPQLRSSGQEVT